MKKFTPFLLTIFASTQIYAATYTAVLSGTWNAGATWGTVAHPGIGDNVIIPAGITVTVANSQTAGVKDLTINATGKLSLNWILQVYGNIVNSGTISGGYTVYLNGSAKTVTSTGVFNITGTGGMYTSGTRTFVAGSVITISNLFTVTGSSTLTNNGTLTLGFPLVGGNASSKFINGPTGTLTVRNTVMVTGILDASAVGNTVIYAQAAGTQNIKIPLSTYYNITFQGAGAKRLIGATTVANNFVWNAAGGAFNMNNFNFSVGGNWTNNANLTASNMATVNFIGTGTITRASTEIFNNLSINTVGTHTLGKDIQVNGNVVITAGTFDASVSNFGIVCKGNWTNNGGTFNGQNGIVTFNNVNQTIGGSSTTTFGTLNANCSGTLTLAVNTAMNHDFNYLTGIVNMANFNLSVGGNWNNTINTTLSNMGTVIFTGTGTVNRASTENFNNLTINAIGTHTLGIDIQVNGNVVLTTGTFDVSGSNFAIVCKGNWTNNGGTFSGQSGVVTFNNVNHTIDGTTSTTFSTLTLAHSGTVTLGNSNAMTGDFDYNTGIVNMATFNFTVGGNWNNTPNVTLSNMGTVTFNGAGVQTITRADTEVFKNITINSTGTVSPAEVVKATGTFTVSGGTFDVTASNFDILTKDYSQTGGTFNAQADTLKVSGNFTHSGGTFTAGTGIVLMNGAAASTIGGASNTQFYDLTCSDAAGVSLTATKTLTHTMTLTVGNFNTGGFDFTLTSTAAGTARIATVPAGSTLLGNSYVVQRRIPGPSIAWWDFLGAPANGSTLARWDNVPGFFMSGIGGNDGCAQSPCYHSVTTFNEGTNAYVNVTTTATALTPGKGFNIWVASNMSQLTAPLTFDTKGTVTSTNQTINLSFTNAVHGYNLIANPMPSQILWGSIFPVSTNIDNIFYMEDQNLGNTYALWNGGAFVGSGLLAGSSGIINSSAGFMVHANGAGAKVVIPETAKTGFSAGWVRTANPTNYVNIKLNSLANPFGPEDMLFLSETASDNSIAGEDFGFLPLPDEAVASLKIMSADAQELISSTVSSQSLSHEIPLKVSSHTAGTYRLTFTGIQNITNYNCVYIQDNQTGKVFNLRKDNTYSFLITQPDVEMTFTLYMENEKASENNSLVCRFETTGFETLSQSVNMFSNVNGFNLDFNYSKSIPVTVEIYNALGESVASPEKTEVTDNTIIVGQNLIKGLYIVRVIANGEILNKKLIHE